MEEMNYPNNIAVIRRMRGLTQATVAQAIGVSRPKYIDIEKGLKEPTVSQVEKLKQILDVDFEDLMGVDTGKFNFRKYIQKDEPNLIDSRKGANSIDDASNSQIFEGKTIRSVWDNKAEKWWFSVVDIIAVLTDQVAQRGASNYWAKLKERLKDEGADQLLTNCQQLKMQATDGKMRKTDVMDTEQIFRLIQSIPSKKAEPFKRWLAQVGAERIEETIDPELSINRKYKDLKGLKKENLRDNMSMLELTLNQLAELATAELTDAKNPQGLHENRKIAKEGGAVAGNARQEIESQTGRPVVTSKTAAELGFVVTNLLDSADNFAEEESHSHDN